MKLVVPNGNVKLTLSYRNGIVADVGEKRFCSKEHDITLTGVIDRPVILDTEKDTPTETIGIEFNPIGAYRLLGGVLSETQNRIESLEDVLGKSGLSLIEEIGNTCSVEKKIQTLQRFLLQQLDGRGRDCVFEYCIDAIFHSNGRLTIAELERKTGYSSRWLNMKFHERLGVSAKNFSAIVRFNRYYYSLMTRRERAFFKNEYSNLYYDQSHFIKDFRRFTGLSPTTFEQRMNPFGEDYFRH